MLYLFFMCLQHALMVALIPQFMWLSFIATLYLAAGVQLFVRVIHNFLNRLTLSFEATVEPLCV